MTNSTASRLADLCAPGFAASPTGDVAFCNGIHHRDSAKVGTCTGCGVEVVRKGSALFAVRNYYTEAGNERRAYCCYRPAHTACEPARAAAHRQAVAHDLAKGRLVVGAPVRVIKGRKVPVGTEGTLTWLGESTYGERAGVRDAAGVTHWLAAGNLALALGAELAAEVEAERVAAEAEAAEIEAAEHAAAAAHDVERIAAAVRAQVLAEIAALVRANPAALTGKAVERFNARGALVGTGTVVAVYAHPLNADEFCVDVQTEDGRRLGYEADELGTRFRFAEPLS